MNADSAEAPHEVRVTLTSVLKNVTITVSEEAAAWARKKAAEENTSVFKHDLTFRPKEADSVQFGTDRLENLLPKH